ncbi:MAG: 50S ribosomal protein L11 methyltransferase [Mogibacterium sp.]|nr:50S ribosomal protein L11 methyltransferase [Mogibacterium sp.]
MRYLELKIKMNKEVLGAVSEALAASGFDEMIISDPADYLEIEEHPEWYKYDYINEELAEKTAEGPEITLYFSDDEGGRREAERAKSIASEAGADCRISETADDSEWLYKWQEHFKPTKVGERIVVKPSWEEYDAAEGELVIEMDPGMAFGSGLHETTTLCIRALEKILRCAQDDRSSAQDDRYLLRVLDVGCGTGILSIAAAMLGADECLGIDIDADAVRVAKENIERNGLTGRIQAVEGDLMEGVDFEPDIIVANLMADLVERLSPAAADHLKPGGIYISSGILDVKCERVAAAVRDAGFEIKEVSTDGEWRAITAIRK